MIENEILDPILDCFGGADGGVSFLNVKNFLREMMQRSENGDASASEVVLVAKRFVKFIEVANGKD